MLRKMIVDYPNYDVSENGEVIRIRDGRTLTKIIVNGSQQVGLYKDLDRKWFCVDRLVMNAFVGPSDQSINHINGVRSDNRLENLQYVSKIKNLGVLGFPDYGVNEDGDVFNLRVDRKLVKSQLNGYHTVTIRNELGRKKSYVHRLVMAAFVGPYCFRVKHLNGIKTDNRLSNLDYTK